MRDRPVARLKIEMQVHLLAGQIVQFGNITERDLAVAIAEDGEANSVGAAILRQP